MLPQCSVRETVRGETEKMVLPVPSRSRRSCSHSTCGGCSDTLRSRALYGESEGAAARPRCPGPAAGALVFFFMLLACAGDTNPTSTSILLRAAAVAPELARLLWLLLGVPANTPPSSDVIRVNKSPLPSCCASSESAPPHLRRTASVPQRARRQYRTSRRHCLGALPEALRLYGQRRLPPVRDPLLL
eukprot:77847-Rhodomonas_salina.2